MNVGIVRFNGIVDFVAEDASALWSGLTNGVESAASWLFTGSQAASAQLTSFGNQLLDRAADYSNRLMSLGEGIGTAAERSALQESAHRLNDYISSTRAAGSTAIAEAAEAAVAAARQAALPPWIRSR